MSDRPKPHGYCDNEHLRRAIDANRNAFRLLTTLATLARDRYPSLGWPVAELLRENNCQYQALTEMERIRDKYKSKHQEVSHVDRV